MIFGTFDIFHPGHQYFIDQALKEGEELIIIIARDQAVKGFKGVLTNPEEKRRKIIQDAYPQAMVVLGDLEDPMNPIAYYRPEKVCLGYDQRSYVKELEKHYPALETKRIDPHFPEKYKSSKLRPNNVKP